MGHNRKHRYLGKTSRKVRQSQINSLALARAKRLEKRLNPEVVTPVASSSYKRKSNPSESYYPVKRSPRETETMNPPKQLTASQLFFSDSQRDVPFTVTIEENGGFRNLDISLQSHCLLCLRRTTFQQEDKSPGGKRSRVEEMEEVATEFLSDDVPSLLKTLGWMWWSLARNLPDVRETVGQTMERGRIVRFATMPTLCQSCGETLRELDTLLNSLEEQIEKVKTLVTVEARRRTSAFKDTLRNLDRTGVQVDSTMDFLEEIWNTPKVKVEQSEWEEPAFLIPHIEDDLHNLDPLAFGESFGDESQDFKVEADNDEDFQRSEDTDEDYVKSEEEEDEKSSDSEYSTPDDGVNSPVESPTLCKKESATAATPSTEPISSARSGPLLETCRVCGVRITRYKLKSHMKSFHNLDEPLPPREFPAKNVTMFASCDLCKLRMEKAELYEHLKGHVGEEYMLRCFNPDCSFACATINALQRHVAWGDTVCRKKFGKDMEEYKRKLCLCPECDFVAGDWKNLRTHLTTYHEIATEKKFTCPIVGCRATFSVQQSVAFHLTVHLQPQRIGEEQFCPLCPDKNAIKLEEMEDHLKQIHGATEIVKCAHCPFLFSSTEQMVDHLYVHRRTIKFCCDICGDKAGGFGQHADLVKHYFLEHQIGREWACDHCTNVYYKQKVLRDHVRVCHSEKPLNISKGKQVAFQCTDCNRVFKKEEGLRSHAIREHGAEPVGCKFCSDTFTSHRAVSEHVKVVHMGVIKQVKDFPCPEPHCEMIFKSKAACQRHHKSVHSGEKHKYECDQCEKSYPKPSELTRHQDAIHRGIRNHVCEECGEAFTTATVLQKHRLIHTGERPFTCELCGQKFRHKTVLQTHLKGHERKGADFKPNGPMKGVRKRVEKRNNDTD